MSFDIQLSTKTCAKTLSLVGERVQALRMVQYCTTERVDDPDELWSTAANCRNLSHLSINYTQDTAVDLLTALLCEKRPVLRCLTLDMSCEKDGEQWDSDATERIAELLAGRTGGIQQFTYASPARGLPNTAFKSFFEANSELKVVHMRLARKLDFVDYADLQVEEEQGVLCFLETIAECQSLAEVLVTEYKPCENYIRLSSPLDSIAAVRKLRMNRVDVSVFNVECLR